MLSLNRMVLLIVVVALQIGVPRVNTSLAQEDAAKGIVGVWEGTGITGTLPAPSVLVFTQEGNKLNWKWSWVASFGKGEAEGTVTKIALPSLELSGAYITHPNPRVLKSPVNMHLTVQGDHMQGGGLTTAVNTPFTVRLTKQQ